MEHVGETFDPTGPFSHEQWLAIRYLLAEAEKRKAQRHRAL